MSNDKKSTKQSFSEILERLEQIVKIMENQDTSLEENMERFEEGIKLVEKANTILEKSRMKLERVMHQKDGTEKISEITEEHGEKSDNEF